jgi:hypothetical protein
MGFSFCAPAQCRQLCLRKYGGVSNVDIDGNNTLYIKVIGVTISTFETLPAFSLNRCSGASSMMRVLLSAPLCLQYRLSSHSMS